VRRPAVDVAQGVVVMSFDVTAGSTYNPQRLTASIASLSDGSRLLYAAANNIPSVPVIGLEVD
jgi:hypothetical protein